MTSLRAFRTILVFAAVWLFLSSPWIFGIVTIPWDAKAHWYPHLVATARAIHAGEAPFWMSSIFAGSPEIADPQSVIFSPLILLALIDPTPSLAAMDRFVYGMLFLAGLGVIGIFRDRDWHWGGAVLAATAFAFGAAAAWRNQHVNQVMALSLLPLAWFFLARAQERRSVLYGALAGLVAGVMVAGRDQVALLGAYLLAGSVIWSWLSRGRSGSLTIADLLPIIAGALVGLLVVAVPVVLSALWGADSNRVAIDIEGAGRGSLHPAHLLTLVIGNLFGAAGPLANHWGPPSPTWGETGLFLARNMGVLYLGAIPCILLIALVRTATIFDRDIRFVSIATIVMIIYALGWYTPLFQAFWFLPGVNFYRRPADAVFIIGGLLSILAGYAAHRMLTGTLNTDWRIEAGVIFAVVTSSMMLALAKAAPISVWSAILIAVGTISLSLSLLRGAALVRGSVLPFALIVSLAADLAITNGMSESTALPPSEYSVLTPRTDDPTVAFLRERIVRDGTRRDRVELLGLGYHWQNAAMSHGFEDVLGFNPVRGARYSSMVGAGDIALVGARRFPPSFPSYRSPLADILGLRFIVTGVPISEIDQKLKAGDLTEIASFGENRVYENPRALPRARIVPRAAPFDPSVVLRGFPEDFDPARLVLVDGPVPTRTSEGVARIVRYTSNLVEVEAETVSGGIMVLADAWHPWWVARIAGQVIPIRRAYGVVRAVEVPAGKATVTFTFEPFAGALKQLTRS